MSVEYSAVQDLPTEPADPEAPSPQEGPSASGSRDQELANEVGLEIDEDRQWVIANLEPDRAESTDYYMGHPFGNEETGKSQVVMTTVRDSVQDVLPSLLRIFLGSEQVVEYRARRDNDKQAAQANAYVNHVVRKDNPGFTIFYGWFKDALVRKIGFVKWRWERRDRDEVIHYEGLSEESLTALGSEPDITIEGVRPEPPAPPLPQTFSAKVTRHIRKSQLVLENCPGEEVSWNRSARTITGADRFTHSCERKLWELLELGVPRDVLERNAGPSSISTDAAQAEEARRFDEGQDRTFEVQTDGDNRPVRYDESYKFCDADGSGNTKLWKICMVGDAHEFVSKEECTHRPFAGLVYDPEPHTLVGSDLADYTKPLQKIESAIVRGTLDSLTLAIQPRTEAVRDQVNMGDLMNTEMGGIVRVNAPGMLREIKHTFVGADTLPMLDKMTEIKENRTGLSRASKGLDADALQSSTKAAVAGTFAKAQERIEMTARIFAETGITDLMRGLLRTIVEHQDYARTLRLTGEWVEYDPRAWDADLDVEVHVGIGGGTTEDRMNALMGIKADQDAVLQLLGPGNPLVSLVHARATRARLCRMAGFPNPDEFYFPVKAEDEQKALQGAQPKQEPQDPAAQAEMMKVQILAQKTQAEIEIKKQELQLRMMELQLADDRARDEQAARTVLAIKEMELKHQTAINATVLDTAIDRERAHLDAVTRVATAKIQADAKPEPKAGE